MEPTQKLRQAVKDYRRGKEEAFTPLYEESSKYIYTCISKVMLGNDNAQDIITDMMQDTYVEISRSISQLEDEERFLQWAGIIATRKCYAYLKKNKKYVLLNEDDSTFDNLSDSDSIIPEEVMQDKEKQRLVREIIENQLTKMQKLCVIAYYYNQQKQSEIAQELGIPENTVKTNLCRARAKIKEGVLDLEKKDGIRLHNAAPFLLLLFKEDVQAAAVPTQVTESVIRFVAASAGANGASGVLGKIASVSVKTKLIGGIVGIAVLGGTVLMANQNSNTWENGYKEFLLCSNEATAFDLNDFDEDGTPEMLVLEKDGDTMVYQYQDKKVSEVYELDAKIEWNEIEYTGLAFEEIDERIEEFKESGNRQRKQNDNKKVKVQETEKEVELSKSEQADIEALLNYLTISSDLINQESYVYDLNNTELLLEFIKVMGSLGGDSKYLPAQENSAKVDSDSANTFSKQVIQEYLKEVFRKENMEFDSCPYVVGDNIVFPIEWYDTEISTVIENVKLSSNESYQMQGTVRMKYFELPEYDSVYTLTVAATKNEDSPFGFTITGLSYKKTEHMELEDNQYQQSPEDTNTIPETNASALIGVYKANNGELEFFQDGKVRVSEGNSSTKCDYTIDSDGNIIISTDSETIEATYFAEEDKVTIYGTDYNRSD